MGVTEHNTVACTGSLHLHGHKQEHEGPWSLRIGIRSQPKIVRRRFSKKKVLLAIDQPNTEDNLTLLYVLHLRGGTKKPSFVRELTFHNARFYHREHEVIEVRIKKRYGNSFSHPLPIGRYNGTCRYDAEGAFAVFTLQAMTLRKEPKSSEPKTIITPGDAEYGLTLRDAKRSLLGADGMGGGGVDAGGLRNG